MYSLVLCYAAADEPITRALGAFIEANLPFDISYGECIVRKDFDLIDAAERGLSADAALVLLSPDSVPKTWRREKWEPVFFTERAEFRTHLGFVLLRECRFPALLRRQYFFDLSAEFTPGAREIKRWLLRPDRPIRQASATRTHLADLQTSIADRPGSTDEISPETARAFIEHCGGDFEAVFRFNCRNRSRAGIVGDIGYALGLKLPGTLEDNLLSLTRHCHEHRCLFVFENLLEQDRDLAAVRGRASTMLTHSTTAFVFPDDLAAAFFVMPRDETRCTALLGAASEYLSGLLRSDFEAGLRLGWALVSALKSGDRFAETVEVLDMMADAASERSDNMALFKIDWELSWIRDSPEGDSRILPTAMSEAMQLGLFA